MIFLHLRPALALLVVFTLADFLAAQIPPVPVAFPNVTQVPGKLLYRSPGQTNRITNIAYHNGVFYTNIVTGADRRVWRFTDPANAASFTQDASRNDSNIPLLNDHGNHAHTKVGDYMGGFYDIGIRRSTPGVNVTSTLPEQSKLHPNEDSHGIYWPWYLPFHWIQYSGLNTPTPTRIHRPNAAGTASETLYEWNSLIEDGVTGNSILIGNLLFITSDESALGILCYDISPVFKIPAQRPILLDKLTGNFGAYIAAPFENYIILSRNDSKKVEVIDYSDPTDLRHVASIDVTGHADWIGDTSVSYIQAQDNFVFAQRHKIDMTNFTPVLEFDQVGNNRPAGSVTGQVDTSQYMLPIGNLLITAGYSFGNPDRLSIWAHQAAPDTRKPYVGYHIPRPGQTNYPIGAPISLLIHETLESFTIINGQTVIVRETGTTTPLDCWISFSHDDVLTITPKSYLALNKTYEVIIVADGIKDAAGNGIEPYSFTFSTGSSVTGGNAAPSLASFTVTPSPASVGSALTFAASATDTENDALEYRFTFGDGTPATAWSASTTTTHTYTLKGHYVVKVQVRDLKPDGSRATVSKDLTVTIANPITATRPTHSSSIAIDSAARRVWSVNPDADTVTVLDADTHAKLAEYNLAALLDLSTTATVDPRSIAIDASGRAWIACHDIDRILVLGPTGTLLQTIYTGYGSAPIGIAVTPNGVSAFVTLTGSGVVKRYSTATYAETGSLAVGPTPRALAITGDSARVLVTRYLSDFDRAHVWDLSNAGSLSLNRTWILQRDRTPDNASNGRGIPNQLAGITLSPDSRWAWVTGSKMNDQHGLLFTGRQSTDNTVRALVLRLDLTRNDEREDSVDRLDIDNSDSPAAVVFSPLGDWAFVALQGNNQVAAYDDISLQSGSSKTTRWRFGTDLAPQGMELDAVTRTLFVNNFMSRSVTTHDLTAFFAQGTRNANTTTHPAVASEKLSSAVLLGKQVFYNASLKDILGFDAMSRDTYISCATCHADGATDNRVWDFTQRGEGQRNTTDLRGRSGMGHGNVHWSANFDEIQDFENDIRDHFGGTGLINTVDISGPLGSPKTGLSPQLDALAAYVSSLGRATYPRSPYRNPADGLETTSAIAGRTVFQSQSCTDCHGGPHFTDSTGGRGVIPRLHDVGTLRTSSGGRLGGTLIGIDTPTLIGIQATAPYFHDGSARTLEDVFTVAGGRVYQAESGSLGAGLSLPGYISQNYYNQPRAGGLVAWDATGTWTLSNVDGGPGGIGALEFIFALSGTRTLTVNVNGTNYSSSLVGQNTGWQWTHYVPHRIENIALTAGLTNTISITSTEGLGLDQVTVSTAADLAKAQPHRRVLALGSTDKNNLLAYLRQLDGSSFGAPEITPLSTFRTTHGLATDGSQDSASPANDGVPNLLKYAFNLIGSGLGQSPSINQPNTTTLAPDGTIGLPLTTLDGTKHLTVTYVRRKASAGPGILYAVHFSDTLATGSWQINPSANSTITSIDSTWERVVVRDSVPLGPRRFARVVVTPGSVFTPVIVSPLSVTAGLNSLFSYAITASDSPIAYSASGLPPGLTLSAATGIISGTTTVEGVYTVTISAENPAGIVTQTLTITVKPLPPVITSATTANGIFGSAFNYQITSPYTVTTYSASGLPSGLTLNPSSGLISGVPSVTGSFTITLWATNSAGSGTATLSLVIDSAFGPNRAVGGIASASAQNLPNEDAAKAFDGDNSTKWLTFNSTATLDYTFGSNARYTLTVYAIVSGNDAPDRDPRNWQLQGSDNGTTWTTIDTRSAETFAERGLAKFYTIAGSPAAYRSYRLNITENNGGGGITQLAELRLHGTLAP